MSNSKSTHEDLIKLYNEVDHFLRLQYKSDKYADHSFLIQQVSTTNPVVARNQQILRAVAQIRNSLIHNPIPAIAQPLLEPSPKLVSTYKNVRDSLLNPANAMSIAVGAEKIYKSSLDAKLSDVLKDMSKNTYTHVPIMDNGEMVGIFSENVLLTYLVDIGETVITDDMTISDVKKFLPLSAQRGESFMFLPRKASLAEVYKIFNEAIKVRKRIGMIFITEHGKEKEKLLGIITAWDLASPELEFGH